MTEELGTKKGDNAKLMQEKKQLQQHIDLLKRQLEEARKDKGQKQHGVVYADRPIMEMNSSTKSRFILDLTRPLRLVFMYISDSKRLHKKAQFNAVFADFKENAEQWSVRNTGNRWLVKSIGFGPKDAHQDTPDDFFDVCLVHKGYLRKSMASENLTPEPIDIMMTVRIFRYELEA